MKGQTKITLNGKDVVLKFTLGVLEDFQDYCEEKDLDSESALSKMKHLRQFLHLMSGGKVPVEDFRELEFSEIEKFTALVGKATGELGNVKGAAKG